MKKIFDPGVIELADPRGDPNQAIEVQEKIGEMIQISNVQRREGLRREIEELGPAAMPGLINATWIWMKELQNDPKIRKNISELMSGFADENSAAADLLLHFGVLDAPFELPRKLACESLMNSQWKPTKEQAQLISDSLKISSIAIDFSAVIDRLSLLCRSKLVKHLNIGTKIIKKWVGEFHSREAGKLCTILIQIYPKRSQQILKDMFDAMTDAHPEGYKDKNIAGNLINAIRPIPGTWLLDGIILELSQEMLHDPARKTPRHTGLEYLWRDALGDLKAADPKNWNSNFNQIGNHLQENAQQMDQDVVQSLYRYWFRAIGEAGEMKYICDQVDAEDEIWGNLAALQLFFSQKDKRARQGLIQLQLGNPERYLTAQAFYEDISGKRKSDTDDIEITRAAGLKK